MTRLELRNLLKTIPNTPIKNPGQTEGTQTSPFIVLKKDPAYGSNTNNFGIWIYWQIMIYVPIGKGYGVLDDLESKVMSTITKDRTIEITGTISEDYIDPEYKCLTRFIQIRTPRGLL